MASAPWVGCRVSSVVEVAKGANEFMFGGRDPDGPSGRLTSPDSWAWRMPASRMDSVSSAEFWPESPETVAAESEETLSMWMSKSLFGMTLPGAGSSSSVSVGVRDKIISTGSSSSLVKGMRLNGMFFSISFGLSKTTSL